MCRHRILPADEDSTIRVVEIEFLPEFLNQQFNDPVGARDLFDFRYISLFLGETELRPNLHLGIDAQKDVNRIIQNLFREYQEQPPLFEHSFKALLLELLILLSRACYSSEQPGERIAAELPKNTSGLIQDVLEYIDEHFYEDLKIENMAKLSTMSQTYFCYFFKLFVGKTFTQYLIDKRLDYAKTALSSSELSITQIAFNAGFNSTSHFIRTFRFFNQLSPGSTGS